MIRTLLLIAAVVLFPGLGESAPPTNNNNNAAKQQKEAQIKAKEKQLAQLRQQLPTQDKPIDAKFQQLTLQLTQQLQAAKQKRSGVEQQVKVAVKQIEQRFEHIISNMEPKQVAEQMKQSLQALQKVKEVWKGANPDYGGYWKAAQDTVNAAEVQLKLAGKNETPPARAAAGRDLGLAHHALERALDYSRKHYGPGKPMSMPESQARSDQQLEQTLPILEKSHHLLQAVDHEIKDFKQEKQQILARRNVQIQEAHQPIHVLNKQIQSGEQQLQQVPKKREEAKQAARQTTEAQIKALQDEIKRLKKP